MKSNKSQALDYYQILGIDNRSAPLSEIKKKYFKLVVTYHPDKNKDADPELFKLIQKAWNCLSNPNFRSSYDESLLVDTTKKSKLKSEFDEYINLQEQKADKKKAFLDFDRTFEEIDRSRGFDRASHLRELEENKKIKDIFKDENEEEIKKFNEQSSRKLSGAKLQRELEDNELFQEDIFKGKKVTGDQFNEKFNEIFDAWKEHNEDDKLIKKDGVMAFNELGGSNFSSIKNLNHDSLFDDDTQGSFINDSSKQVKNIDKLKLKGSTYFKGHNQNRETVSQDFEKFRRDRELDLQNIKYEDYIENDSSIFEDTKRSIDYDDDDEEVKRSLEFFTDNN